MFHSTSSKSGRSNNTRPHSKTTVTGPSLKTRLHCNHLRPKCKCPNISNQKRSHKAKHTVPRTTTSQRRVLSSSRSLPRGETNGRKVYHSTDESVSVCDATWRPNLSSHSEDKPKTDTENHTYRQGDDKVIKKKLRFEDQILGSEEKHSIEQITDPVRDTNKNQTHGEPHPLPPHKIPSTHSKINIRKGSDRKGKEISGDYCRLCEETEKGHSYDSYRKRKKDVPTSSNENTSQLSPDLNYISYKEDHEICFLCHRNKHSCRNYDNFCRICNTHIYSHGSQENVAGDRQSQNQRHTPARHTADDEDQQSSPASIPYKPRTKFVENLKQRLETTYRKDSSILKERDTETHKVSAGTESSRDPQRQHSDQHHMHPGKKCLHRYQQNDRLFLEPTMTDRKGQSICGECGAPQPSNPQKDPYVYHITLGGMKSADETTGNGSRSRSSHRDKENGTAYLNRPRKKSNDTSEHIYAKLNDSIDKILWRKGIHSTSSRPSVHTNVLASLYSKRHPSRSMALVDHLI